MPGSITVIGLGPGDPDLRTLAAARALAEAETIVLRTGIHPGLADLTADPRVTTCDDLYEQADDFSNVYSAIADRVLATARHATGAVVFAVPGHSRFGEASLSLIEARAAAEGIPCTVQDAVSALDVVVNALALDPFLNGLQIVDALDLLAIADREPFAGGALPLDPARPCIVGQLYATHVAIGVKLALGRLYPDDHVVTIVHAAGIPGEERLETIPLHALDRAAVDHLTTLSIPALPSLAALRSPLTLQRIIARLRAPGGCPWDREQTHASIRGAVIEEAYETVDAIDTGDLENLTEELGDLVLQAVLHAQIAEEAGDFTLEDVFETVSRKLLRRHPHVFGEIRAETADDVVATWDAVKAQERADRADSLEAPAHPLDRLPRSMPALHQAIELLGPRLAAGLRGNEDDDPAVLAVGERLLSEVDAAITGGIDPEQALRAALRHRFSPLVTAR